MLHAGGDSRLVSKSTTLAYKQHTDVLFMQQEKLFRIDWLRSSGYPGV